MLKQEGCGWELGGLLIRTSSQSEANKQALVPHTGECQTRIVLKATFNQKAILLGDERTLMILTSLSTSQIGQFSCMRTKTSYGEIDLIKKKMSLLKR